MSRAEWPVALREVFAASQPTLPLRFRGYDRLAVDEALADAAARREAAVEEAEAYADLACVLDGQLAEARAALAEFDRLHAGEEVRSAEDAHTRDVVGRARQDALAVVEDARREARLLVAREQRAVASRAGALEDEERDGRQRLASSTDAAGDVLRAAASGCARLLARFAERQRVLEEWTREFSGLLDVLPSFRGTVGIPRSRRPEEVGGLRTEVELDAEGAQ
ncbi:hypothetical protein [Umezawaea sp.]|uniref:hypothetical protein n=1 Tax=Umezawaea sp. TaxID=1955258 RepID=UPI002ED15911